MFKKLLQKGKCLLGFHEGEWNYEQPAQCTQTRLCTLCQKRQERTHHIWAEWEFERERDCAQRRVCERCAESEERVTHNWAAPEFVEEGSCEQVRRCARCEAEEPTGASHQWGRWEYAIEDHCSEHQICERCGARSTHSRLEHCWSEWQESAHYGGAVRVCRRCGEMEVPVRATSPAAAIEQTEVDHAPLHSETPLAAPLDVRVVGHWRHTECLGGGGGFSMTTDTHWILAEDGRCARYSHSVSGMGERQTPPREGVWETADGVLRIRDANGGVEEHVYQVTDSNLFLPQAGHLRLWERL